MPYPMLTEKEVAALNRGHCADCSSSLVEGPSGGGSINYYCSQRGCGSKFNLAVSWERISEPSPNERSNDR
jgi:hypothetical protein